MKQWVFITVNNSVQAAKTETRDWANMRFENVKMMFNNVDDVIGVQN